MSMSEIRLYGRGRFSKNWLFLLSKYWEEIRIKCLGFTFVSREKVIAISQRGYTNGLWCTRSGIRPKFWGVLLKACFDKIIQVITTRFFNKPHSVVWFLIAKSFLVQSIFLSHLAFDFRGYPRELAFYGRTPLRNVIYHSLCKSSFKDRPIILYRKVLWSWSKEFLCNIRHGLP